MELKRYYWVRYTAYIKEFDYIATYTKVTDEHPFVFTNASNVQLIDWKQISVEEYNLRLELNKK